MRRVTLVVAGLGLALCLASCTLPPNPRTPSRPSPRPTSGLLPEPSPQPPGHARQVEFDGIGQWADHGTTITGLWMNLEAGKLVQVKSEISGSRKVRPTVYIDILDEATSGSSQIGGFTGGAFHFPHGTGVALTWVSGTIPGGSLRVGVRYWTGFGLDRYAALDPFSGTWSYGERYRGPNPQAATSIQG